MNQERREAGGAQAERELDAAIAATFPASDPTAMTDPTRSVREAAPARPGRDEGRPPSQVDATPEPNQAEPRLIEGSDGVAASQVDVRPGGGGAERGVRRGGSAAFGGVMALASLPLMVGLVTATALRLAFDRSSLD